MGNLRRYYYANKAKIWRLLLIVAFILVIIQLLNYFQSKKVVNQGQLVQNGTDKVISNTSLSTDQSALGTGTVNEQKLKEDITIIDNFLNLCNNKKFEEAYEILSDECKECLFDTYDNFKNNYCDKIFNSYKMYTTENWSGNTYIVKIKEDPLASGNINNDTEIQEYITIVENGDKDKLNINNYIGRKKIEKENTQNDITIKVLSSDTFTEYEIYNIQVKNNTENTIYLDDGQDTSTFYIEDENNLKYEAASGEVIFSTLQVPAGSTINYSIKYTNSYRTNRKINKLVFGKLILNYDEYLENINSYNNTVKFEINF